LQNTGGWVPLALLSTNVPSAQSGTAISGCPPTIEMRMIHCRQRPDRWLSRPFLPIAQHPRGLLASCPEPL